jgi:hypothetical protein
MPERRIIMASIFNFTGAVFDEITAEAVIAHRKEVMKLNDIVKDMNELIMASTESSEDIQTLFMINELSEKLYTMCDRVSVELEEQDQALANHLDSLGMDFWRAHNISDWLLRAWREDGHWDTGLHFEEKVIDILATLSKQED